MRMNDKVSILKDIEALGANLSRLQVKEDEVNQMLLERVQAITALVRAKLTTPEAQLPNLPRH